MLFEITYDLRANSGRRFANYIIDLVAQYAILFGLGFLAGLLTHVGIYGPMRFLSDMGTVEEYVMGYAIGFVYYFLFETFSDGRTFGKLITNTKVLTWDGARPSAGTIAKRSLCRMIPFEAFSFLTSEPLGWHDKFSDTVVVDIKKYNEEHNLRQGFHEIGMPAE
jgi:uncharacterized RDD family membrane protein YckC